MGKSNFFANGQMSEEETDAFLGDLLRKKFDNAQKEAWSNQLRKGHAVYRSTPPEGLRAGHARWGRWARAAAVALLLFATVGIYLSRSKPAHQQLADEFIHQEKMVYGDFRKGANEVVETRMKAADAYQRGDYQSALQYWQALKNQGDLQADDQFFFALTLLYLKDYEAAAAAFEAHAAGVPSGGRFEQENAYFHALALIKTGRLEESKTALRHLREKTESQFLKSRVERLLGAME